ncbi:ankyrin [Neocallimastix lanati (nom. inval.)]|nr:ankyrin [Neocallimastix sp. JGI-2020a]
MIISHISFDDIIKDIDKRDMNTKFQSSYKNYIKKINIDNPSPYDIKLIENAIENNSNEEFIEYCMELYGFNFNYSKILANPIFLALKNNNLYIAQKLIDCGADINYNDHYQGVLSYLLMTDSLNKKNLQFLIKNKIQLNIELFDIIEKMPNTSELISSIKNFFKPNNIKNDIKIYPFDFLIFQERNNEKINDEKEILLMNILKCETYNINTINYRTMEYIVKRKIYNLLEVLIHNKEEFIESELCIHALKYASSICDDIDILTYLIKNIDNEYIFDKYGLMLAFEIVKKQNIEDNRINLMRQLIDKGININEKYNNSLLLIESIKSRNNNLTKMLITNDANVHIKDEERKNALMLSIIYENNYDIMELLLQKNIDINDKDSTKNTALHYACKYNNINIIKTLINEKYKLKINEKNANGQTPLMISIIKNNWSCALQLLECDNIDPNIANEDGNTPLIYMTTNSIHQREIYRKLFKHKAYFNFKYINNKSFLNKIIENDELIYGFKDTGIFIDNGSKNIKKFNLLIFAIKINNMDLLKKLLICDLNPNEKDDSNETPLLFALKQNNIEAIKILIENKADFITDKQQIIHLATKSDDEKILKYIFELENINESDAFSYDNNCIYIFNACGNDDINSLENIIKNNDVSYIINEKNEDGLTPFSYSIKERKYKCAEYLLDNCNNIDVNAIDNSDHTAIDYFIINKVQDKYDLLEKLINRGGFIDSKYFKKQLLDYIICNNDLIKYFINKGIPIRDNKGERTYKVPNPLIFSVKQNSYPFVKALLENKIPIDEIDSNHKSAMIYAIDNGNKSIIELLLEYKFDINKTYDDERDITPIIYTVEKNKPSLFNYLLSTVSTELDEDQIISSIIAYSLNHKNFDMIEFIENNSKYNINSIGSLIDRLLAESKIDLTSKNENGYSLSHYACFKGKLLVIKELFKNNQDFNLKNEEERTPLMIAIIYKKYDCVKYLLKEDQSLDVNCKDVFGETAMSYLLKNLDYDDEIIELLYKKDYYFNKIDFKDENRLKYIMKCISLLKLFIERGIKLKTKKNEITIIKTPVIFSVKNNIKNLLISLLNLRADANEKDNDNKSPLYYAIFNNNIDLIHILLNYNANINEEIMSGKTALIYVIENNKENIFNNIIQNRNIKDNLDAIIQYVYDYALRLKNFDIITFLVERFKDKEYNIYTPLNNLLNSNKFDLPKIINDNGWNLLHYASHTGNVKLLTLMLKGSLQLDINKKCNDGSTPLMLSIKNEKFECAAHLIDNYADVNIYDGNGDTPLVYMLNHDSSFNDYIFDNLIKKGAFFPIKYIYDIDYLKRIINNKWVMKKITYQGLKIENENGEIRSVTNSLIYAAKHSNNIFAEELIRNGSTINDTDEHDNNALIYALINKNTKLVKLLLSHNIDCNYSNINNKSPIIIAINNDDSVSFKLIIDSINNSIEKNETIDKIIKNIIKYAKEINNYNIIKYIHKHLDRESYFNYEKLNDIIKEKDKNYNVKENKVNQPLHFACMHDNNDEIKNLTNIYINEQNNDGSTPLMVAIKNQCYKNVNLLFDSYPKIDVNIDDYHGMTPLTYLINNNKDHIDQGIILLKRGAFLTLDYIKKDNNFENLLKSNVVVQYLMENGIHVKEHNIVKYISSKNLTKYAIDNNLNKLLKAMIKNNLDIENEKCNGKSAILYAIENNNKDAFNMFIKQIPKNVKQSILKEVINKAFTSMDCSILGLLKNWTNNTDIINIINDTNNNNEIYCKEGYKPLHLACIKNNFKLISSLINAGYDVNTADKITKETALITAIKNRNYEVVKVLLNTKDINVNIYDSKQNTPLMYMINDLDYENNEIFENFIINGGNKIKYFDLLLHSLKMKRINYSKIILKKFPIDISNLKKSGKTIMSYLIDNKINFKEGFDLLFEKGAYIEPNYINDNKCIELIETNIGLIKSIVQNGFYTKQHNNVIQVKTPVIFFIKSSKNTMIEKLLENKASVEEKDEDGNTPIFHSIRSNNIKAFLTLLKYDADTTKRNNIGQTPLIYAEKRRKNSYFINELKKPRSRRSSNTDTSQKLNSQINQKNDDYIENNYIKRRENSNDSNDNMDNLLTISDIINNNKLNKSLETKKIKYADMASVSLDNVEPKIDYIRIDSKDNSIEKVNDDSDNRKIHYSKKELKNLKNIKKENQLITEKPQSTNYLLNNKLDIINYLSTGKMETLNEKKSKKLKKSFILIEEESNNEHEEESNSEYEEESNSEYEEESNSEYEEESNSEYEKESNSEYEEESNSEYEEEPNREYYEESNSEYEKELISKFNEVSNNEYEEETFVSAIDSSISESIKNTYNNEKSIESINHKNVLNIDSRKKIHDEISDNDNQVINDKTSSNIDEININQTIDTDKSTFSNDETSINQIINDTDEHTSSDDETNTNQIINDDIIKYPELHYACLKENEGFIKMFIDFSYDINEQCDDGSTPLLLSIKKEKFKSVEILINNKADVNIPDNEGVTPLLYAVKNYSENEELIEKLLSNGANPNYPDKTNEMKTPLIYATEYGNNNLVRLLIKNKANIEYKTEKGITPLKIAVKKNNLAIARILLSSKKK